MPSVLPPLELQDPAAVADTFRQAAQACPAAPVADLPSQGRLVITGDLHDNADNFRRILKLAALDAGPDRRLVLHELVHGPSRVNGCDLSVRMLARAADLKRRYPDQVHLLQANHELAQLNGEGILKQGASVVEAFNLGVEFLYGDMAPLVTDAMNDLIRSLPLAVRCANGVMACHSLPGPRKLEGFDRTVLDRPLTDADLAPGGHAHNMVWGRNHTDQVAAELGEAWGVRQFVMGHQPAEMGYETEGERMLILASDHNHGVALPIDLSREYDQSAMVQAIKPLNAVAL